MCKILGVLLNVRKLSGPQIPGPTDVFTGMILRVKGSNHRLWRERQQMEIHSYVYSFELIYSY